MPDENNGYVGADPTLLYVNIDENVYMCGFAI